MTFRINARTGNINHETSDIMIESISDIDSDTQIHLEKNSDEDIIRFDTGNALAGYQAQTDIMTISSSGIFVNIGEALALGASGGDIDLNAGIGGSQGAGGFISLTTGHGQVSGNGGNMLLTADDGGTFSGNGGNITITTGSSPAAASGNGGNFTLTTGSNLGNFGDVGNGGGITITSGSSVDGNGGNITITAGDGTDAFTTGHVAGSVIIKPGLGVDGTLAGPPPMPAADGTIQFRNPSNTTIVEVLNESIDLSPHGTAAGNTTEIRFRELVANGSNYVGFKAPDSITTNTTWALPDSDGTIGQTLITDGSGNLFFQSPAYMLALLSADQTTNLALNDHIEFNTSNSDNGIISLATGSGQANGLFTLPANRIYRLECQLSSFFSSTVGSFFFSWRNNTSGTLIGSLAGVAPFSTPANETTISKAVAIIAPSVSTQVEVRISGAPSSLTDIPATGSYVIITEIK